MKKSKKHKGSRKTHLRIFTRGIKPSYIILIIVFLMISAGYINFAPVAWIDGEAVDRRELKLYMDSHRSYVYGQYQKKYNAEYSKNFWTRSFNGQKPVNTLKETALEKLKKVKAAQILARDLGVRASINYRSFLFQLKDENARRKKVLETGGIIYGPQQYDEQAFYEYLQENMLIQIKEKLKDTLFKPSEEELKLYYEENRKKMFRIVDTVDTEWIYIKSSSRNSALNVLERIRLEMEETRDFDKCIKEINGGKYKDVLRTDRQFGGMRAKEQAINEPELYNSALALNAFETSEMMEIGETIGFLACTNRNSNSFIPYNDCRDNVVRAFIDDKYQDYIDAKIRSASVTKNSLAWDLVRVY